MKLKRFFYGLGILFWVASFAHAAESFTAEQLREMLIAGVKNKTGHVGWNPSVICNIREISVPGDGELNFTDENHLRFKVKLVFDEVANQWLYTKQEIQVAGFVKKNGNWVFGSSSVPPNDRRAKAECKVLDSHMLNNRQLAELKSHTLKNSSFDQVYQSKTVKRMPEAKVILQALANAIGHSEKTFNSIMGAGMAERVYDIVLNDPSLRMKESQWLDQERFFVPVEIEYKTAEDKNGELWLGSWRGTYGVVCKDGRNGYYISGCQVLAPAKGGLSSKAKGPRESFHDKFAKAGKGS